MTLSIKSYNQRLGVMVKKILSDTSLSDLRVGSVISAILQAAAQSDFEIETSIVEMIKLFSIDTTEGSDLDRRAAEFNIKRYTALPASDVVRVGDSSFTKKSSKIYIGLPPPVVGDTVINVEDVSTFPVTGQVYIGRGTGNYEGPISYTSLTNNISYWSINLSSPITKNHTGSETVILAQGGNRSISAGTIVKSPANNFSPASNFSVVRTTVLVDGEVMVDGVPVIATVAGTVGNVPAGSIRDFSSLPFPGATVTNITAFSSGRDIELDSSLRSRIRNAIQLIARGTKRSILQAVSGVSDPTDNKRVASAALAEPINATVPAQLYIDDGTGFEPSFAGQGVERIVDDAAGSEKLIQVAKFPVTPPILVSASDEPFGVQPEQTLEITVDKSQETITFTSSDLSVPGSVKAREIIDAINSQSTYVTARSARNGVAVALVAKRFFDGTDPETLQIVGGDANSSIKFPVTPSRVMSLYKNGILLKKNPSSAVIYTLARTSWSFGGGTVAAKLIMQVDGTPVQEATFRDSDFVIYGTTYKTATSAQWAAVMQSKFAGISATVESGRIKVASNRQNSAGSILEIFTATDLGARSTTAAVWQSGTTVRYFTPNTTSVIPGDLLTVSGFANGSNNGIFLVTKVSENEFVDVTSSRLNSSDDESSLTAMINPNKEDLSLVAFSGSELSEGAASEYNLNRFSGEIELFTKLSSGDNVTAGSEYTRAYIDSIATGDGKYNFPYQQDVAPALFVAIDSNCTKRTFLISNGDTFTQQRVVATDNVEFTTSRTDAFADTSVGDFVYIATKSVSGVGTYSTWFPSYATGIYEVTQKIDNQTLYIRNPDPSYSTLLTGIAGATEDVQIFITDGMIQKIPLSGVNLLPSAVVSQINSVIQFGVAVVFNNKYVRLQSNSFTQNVSKIFILATAGTAKNLFSAGSSGTANQPHIGFQVANVEGTTFPRMRDGLSGFLDYSIAKELIFGYTTASSLAPPYENIDSTKTYLSDVKNDDIVRYLSGINRGQSLSIRSIDSNTQLTPQTYNSIRPIFAGDNYVISESHKFSPYDKLIVELDQDSTNKTFLIPMYRTGKIKGTATTTQFDAYDVDSAPGIDFNNSMWQGFSFQDFSLMFRARNIYKSSATDSSVIIRSAIFGEVGEGIKFGIFYPTTANQSMMAIHQVLKDETKISLFLSSGPARTGVSAVGSGYKLSRSGNSLILDYAGIGPAPNFSGNGVLAGDIASITDAAFAGKSSFFIGSGKVTSVSATQLIVNLPNTATISTSYAVSASQDSGSGTTTTYLLASTGLLGSGDKVQISGFSRSINNGVFTVVGVAPNTSITVSHSNRTVISYSTIGFRTTSTLVSLQFAGSVTGQVLAGDSVVISGMSDSNLNGTFTVSAIITTNIANDTIQFTSALASDSPVSRSVTSAVWQSGTTVRYACSNTGGINIGNYVDITGFVNSSNNGNFLVSNVITNSYIEVVSTRIDGTDDEIGPISGVIRPTYFTADTGGTVQVKNNETVSATADLIVTQVYAQGVSIFPLGTNTAAAMIGVINSDPIVGKVITAVNALGYLGTGNMTKSTADESISVGYGHSIGSPYIQLYDGSNYVLDFTSATVNPFKNFTLKKSLVFSHVDYDPSTAPNIPGEQVGEYFKMSPTTFRNIGAWLNKSTVTSFSIAGSAVITADGSGKLQVSSQTIGTSGAMKVTGGGANGIGSFLKTPTNVDNGAIRCQVNAADMPMFTVGQVVKVQNYIASRKPKNFAGGDTITVVNLTGTTGLFKVNGRVITLAGTNSITISDVSASYGRSAGIVWRWTATSTPASPFLGVKVGDSLSVSNSNLNILNQTPVSFGDGFSSYFPIVSVDVGGQWIDVHNPFGVAEGPISLVTVDMTVSPSFSVEWKHRLSTSDVMTVESVGLNNLMRYSWVSGSANPLFAQNGVSVDDYVIISGNTFTASNRGLFRVIAVADEYFVVENASGTSETVSVSQVSDIKFLYSESTITGDKLNVSDIVFSEPNRGTFEVINYGSDATLKAQYVKLSITNSSSQASVTLTGLPNTFFVTDGVLFSTSRKIVNFAIDPTDNQSAIVYLYPATNFHKMSNSFNTSITPTQKFSFLNDTAIGVDGYRYYTGLLATVQKTVDGYDPDPINYPGYKAAGTQIETVPPLIKSVSVNVIVKTKGGINISTVSDSIKSSVLNYIKSLGVGEDIIVSEITAAVMSVEGVESATLFDPTPTTERIVIQDNEKAVISIDQITVSSG